MNTLKNGEYFIDYTQVLGKGSSGIVYKGYNNMI